jgi:dihydroorotase
VTFDLIVTGGHVIDPDQGIDRQLDVGVRFGRIAALGEGLRDQQGETTPSPLIVNAVGAIVVPGLVDLHAHVYPGVCPLTVSADETSSRSGVTTVISAGDAGAHTIEGFKLLSVNQSRTRVLAFLHISTIGLASFPVGESENLQMLDIDAGERAVERFRDIVVGIKVREGAADVVGDNAGLEPLRRAVELGRRVNLPVMVHITGSPAAAGEILGLLRGGDIVTHCYTSVGTGILEEGRVAADVWSARERGVIFDVGHGAGSFDFGVAEAAVREGLWPDTISTDLHSISARIVPDLPTTMSKMLALEMPLEEVIAAVTIRPAQVIGWQDRIGSLREGRVADIAVLDVSQGDGTLTDSFGQARPMRDVVTVRSTIRGGVPWVGPLPHPGVGIAVIAD